jgi:hypothetical protein
VNQDVFGPDGRRLCIADLFDAEAGMVVEHDGAEHPKAVRHSRDVAREDLLDRREWIADQLEASHGVRPAGW